MRKILFILLLFPLTLSAQTFFPVQNLYVKDAFRFGSFYFVKNADSLWLEKPLGTYICRLDTNIIGTGSTITASDGVYMDGDTMKLGGNATYNDFTVYKLVDDKYFDITDVNENFGLSFSTFSGNYGTTLKGGLVGWPRSSISANSSGVNLGYSKTSGGNTLTLQVNDGGAVFSEMPDTTLTTPNHLMTEQQVKREIAAAQRWTDISGGISYGNEVTIGSLAGTGNRNIGADSNGKLIDLAVTPGVLQSTTINLTASQIYNNTWVTAVPAPGAGKMIIFQNCIIYYKHITTSYTVTGDNIFTIRYNGGGSSDLSGYVTNILNSEFSRINGGLVISVNAFTPSSNALEFANTSVMAAPTGDGTLTVTIYYTIIDI